MHDDLSLDEACHLTSFHPNSLKRLLRAGQVAGYKDLVDGRRRWRVSRRSLERYVNSIEFGYERPGPKPYLSQLKD